MTSLHAVCADARRLLAKLLVHLNEIEARRLDLKAACPSLYEFCVRRLGMSDGEACRRIAAARLVKRFPSLLPRIESGELNLTSLHLLRHEITEANVEQIVEQASGKSKREVQELVARRSPRSEVLPVIAPIAKDRHEVRFTASTALRDKIERAKDLLRHRDPKCELESVMNRAFDALIAQLEKETRAKVERPREPKSAKGVSAEIRRAVFARDGEQCTFTDEHGNRCCATTLLELDHILALAFGGESTVENLRVRCRAHNRLHAEEDFGVDHVASKIGTRASVGKPSEVTLVEGALLNLGFRAPDARRALTQITTSREELPPLDQLLREALLVLT